MRFVAPLLATLFVLAACVGEDPNPVDGQNDGGPGNSGDCKPDEKKCGETCVPKNDPRTGCGSPLCNPCEDAPFSTTTCDAGGQCSFQCDAGRADCNDDKKDGCEIQLLDDAKNCGKCGNACGSANTTKAPTCAAGKCVFDCIADHVHCDAQPDASGCETDLTSKDSCGACGRSCLGANCTNKDCEPIQLADQTVINGLALDNADVYFTVQNENLRKVSKNGPKCALTACTNWDTASGNFTNPNGIAIEGTAIAFGANGQMRKSATVNPGGASGGFASGNAALVEAGNVAACGGFVFWTDGNATTAHLLRAKQDGTQVTTLATTDTTPGRGGVACDGTNVFWGSEAKKRIYTAAMNVSTSCVEATAAGAGNCTIVADSGLYAVGDVAVDANNVYWNEPNRGAVVKAPKAGGAKSDVSTGSGGVLRGLATDGKYVYWGVTTENKYKRTKVDSPCANPMPVCETFATAIPLAIVLDDKAAYWIDRTPSSSIEGIYKKAK